MTYLQGSLCPQRACEGDAPDKSSGKRRQKVHIEYDLVGYIPVDELLKAEQA